MSLNPSLDESSAYLPLTLQCVSCEYPVQQNPGVFLYLRVLRYGVTLHIKSHFFSRHPGGVFWAGPHYQRPQKLWSGLRPPVTWNLSQKKNTGNYQVRPLGVWETISKAQQLSGPQAQLPCFTVIIAFTNATLLLLKLELFWPFRESCSM